MPGADPNATPLEVDTGGNRDGAIDPRGSTIRGNSFPVPVLTACPSTLDHEIDQLPAAKNLPCCGPSLRHDQGDGVRAGRPVARDEFSRILLQGDNLVLIAVDEDGRMGFSVILDLGCHTGARFKRSIRRRACRNRGSVRGRASEAIMREAGGLWKETLPLAC